MVRRDRDDYTKGHPPSTRGVSTENTDRVLSGPAIGIKGKYSTMPENTISSVHCAIDWVTLTATDDVHRRGLCALGEQLVASERKGGNDVRNWRWKSFDGQHCKRATWGRRDDCDILQLSGELADEQLDHAYLTSDHCTRIDLAVTWKVGADGRNIADRTAGEVLAWKEATNSTLGFKVIADNGRSNCIYLGSRTSDLFARCYDKGAESGEPALAGFWRWELEVKGQPAQRAIAALHSLGNRADRIRDAVCEHFARRGSRPEWSGLDPTLRIDALRAPSDDSTRLNWLASSVRPSVQRLLLNGHTDAVFAALGMDLSLVEQYRERRIMEWGNHAWDCTTFKGEESDAT